MTTVNLPRIVPGLSGRTVTAENSDGTVYLVRRTDGEFQGVHAVTGDVEAAGVALAERHESTFMTTAEPVKEKPKRRAAPDSEPLLTPAEVGAMFRVDPKTVTRWAKAGKIDCIFTLGGHRRFRESEVRALLTGGAA